MYIEGKWRHELRYFKFPHFSKWFVPPHPTWQSKESKNRVFQFLNNEKARSPFGLRLNVGSGFRHFGTATLNLDLLAGEEIDIQGDSLNLPIKDEILETVVCTGVLEHVPDSNRAISEIFRVLKNGGRVYIEIPFMQTVHASPEDYFRWTPDGLKQLMCAFDVVDFKVLAGPGTALAWVFQETMALLFSFRREIFYKAGLRLFGWMSVPISWLDRFLEKNPQAWRAASGFSVEAVKPHQ